MASIFLSRDTKVYVKVAGQVWEIPVLDGFSFSQSTNTSEVTVSEMGGVNGASRRGRKVFTDSLAPAEWSFSTYARPFTSAGGVTLPTTAADGVVAVHAVEEIMWALMANSQLTHSGVADSTAVTLTNTDIAGNAITYGASSSSLNFAGSNNIELQTFELFFKLGTDPVAANNLYYQVQNAIVNEASFEFDLDGIATINWSGMGVKLDEISDTEFATAVPSSISEGAYATDNFIRNRLTTLTTAGTVGDGFNPTYNIVLTGGSITISNNVSYVTPEVMSLVNNPIGHFTGARSVTGSFTAYLDTTAGSTADLFNDIQTNSSIVTNSFDLTFKVGGATGRRVEIGVPKAHIEIPAHSIEDVIAVEVNFSGLGTDIDTTDEIAITYAV